VKNSQKKSATRITRVRATPPSRQKCRPALRTRLRTPIARPSRCSTRSLPTPRARRGPLAARRGRGVRRRPPSLRSAAAEPVARSEVPPAIALCWSSRRRAWASERCRAAHPWFGRSQSSSTFPLPACRHRASSESHRLGFGVQQRLAGPWTLRPPCAARTLDRGDPTAKIGRLAAGYPSCGHCQLPPRRHQTPRRPECLRRCRRRVRRE